MSDKRRSSIVTPTVLLTSSIAAIAIVIGALVSYPLILASTQDVGQRNLAQLANVTASSLEQGFGNAGLSENLVATLQRESISAYLFSSNATPETVFEDLPLGFSQQSASDLLAGLEVSERVATESGEYLFEGRPLTIGGAVLLVQPVSVAGASAGELIGRLAIALVIGLVVAIPIGYIAARRLAKPLRRASAAARDMAQGARGVHVTPEGPAEVSDIAKSLNALDQALANSESRQREFLMSVSHELRTPLTAIKGYGEALSDGMLDEKNIAAAGAVIGQEAQRLDRLVNDLLDLARLGAVDFAVRQEVVDFAEFAHQACEVWKYRCAEEQVNFECSIKGEGEFIFDATRVRQIIDNLAENALRVTPPQGFIALSLRVAQHQLLNHQEELQIELTDTGPGLSSADLAVAFQPGALYERYRGVRPVGTGLGLALVDRLAKALGGVASVSSEAGTTFVISIPVHAAYSSI